MILRVLMSLMLGCSKEQPYDLASIPIKVHSSDSNNNVITEQNPTKTKNAKFGNPCLSTNQIVSPAKKASSIEITFSLPKEASSKLVLIDFILPKYGEIQYGLVCRGTDLHLLVPKMLGMVHMAIFVDEREDGPSYTDPQGLYEDIEINTNDIDLGVIELNASLSKYYTLDADDTSSKSKDSSNGDAQ